MGKSAHEGNLRDKAFVVCFIHGFAKEYDQSGHQQKYGEEA